MNMHAKQQILDTFADADLSIVEEVLYFNGWVSDEECGGYLMFRGIDGSIRQVKLMDIVRDLSARGFHYDPELCVFQDILSQGQELHA